MAAAPPWPSGANASPSKPSSYVVSGFSRTVVTLDGVRLRTELVTDGLVEPTDLAFAPDGRIVVAERTGQLSVAFDDGGDQRLSGDWSSYGSNVLRLNAGGSGDALAGAGTIEAVETLLQDQQFGALRAIGVSPRGEIYFCTGTLLVRLGPSS